MGSDSGARPGSRGLFPKPPMQVGPAVDRSMGCIWHAAVAKSSVGVRCDYVERVGVVCKCAAIDSVNATLHQSDNMMSSHRLGISLVIGLCLVASCCGLAAARKTQVQVQLAQGQMGQFRWSVTVKSERSGNPKRPCIATITSAGESEVCGSLNPLPLLLGDSSGAGPGERTVLALGFPEEIGAVRLWLRGKRDRVVHLALLTDRQARRVGLEPFRYAARVYAGSFCLLRFATLDRNARVINVSPKMPCGL
jgi:hypothetical protein